MKNWQEDLLVISKCEICEHEILRQIEAAGRALGFEYCAYGLRAPVPFSNPRTVILNNYPTAWQERYTNAGYLQMDPTVLHGRQSQKPLVWSDSTFSSTLQLWDEARSFGLCIGWAQSTLDSFGTGGMLTLARSHEVLSATELEVKEKQMQWLTNLAHLSLSRALNERLSSNSSPKLTPREIDILKWTADGKTALEISDILAVSKNTVDFHIKNAVTKLQTRNKTAAVVRAAILGMLN